MNRWLAESKSHTVALVALASSILIAFALVAQQQPILHSVVPAVVPTTGGSRIELHGERFLATCFFPVCDYVLSIGDVPAQDLLTVTDDLIVAITPPHPSGTVDITLHRQSDDVVFPDALTYAEAVPALHIATIALLAITLMGVGIVALRHS